MEALEAFLDEGGVGYGRVTLTPIGDGHSNLTYALRRGAERFVLRRPPHGPLPPSAHDVLREARLLAALGPTTIPVPEVLAVCDRDDVIGAPFYVTTFVDGHVLGDARLPPTLEDPGARSQIAERLIDVAAELHALGPDTPGLDRFGRGDRYLDRQVRRFGELLARNATRPLSQLEAVADWLAANLPQTTEVTLVHGDFRLGNVMFAPEPPPRVVAVLDWELATVGDPLADLGYLTATWADPDDPPNPMLDLCAVTRLAGFPDRATLARRYGERTGRDLTQLGWYQTLALWKSAIFLEGSYRRFRDGRRDDPFFATLEHGVPALASAALASTRSRRAAR
jgi:aminoglycoside phosphotransferase (APT) family kinase protein